MGREKADWARLPRAERERVLTWYHNNFNTPDDLAVWPPEIDGGLRNP
jgi:hypothetical protein